MVGTLQKKIQAWMEAAFQHPQSLSPTFVVVSTLFVLLPCGVYILWHKNYGLLSIERDSSFANLSRSHRGSNQRNVLVTTAYKTCSRTCPVVVLLGKKLFTKSWRTFVFWCWCPLEWYWGFQKSTWMVGWESTYKWADFLVVCLIVKTVGQITL